MIGLGIVLGIFLFIALIHVGVRGEYSADGIVLDAYAGPVTIHILPQGEKKPKEDKPKKEKKKKEPKPKEKKPKQGADLDFLLELVSAGIEALGSFCGHLRIRRLAVHFTAASADPFSAAMQFGGVSAGAGYLTALIRRHFHVKKLELYSDIDFEAKKPTVYAAMHAGIPVWAVVSIGVRFLVRFLRARKSGKTAGETQNTNTNGKADT